MDDYKVVLLSAILWRFLPVTAHERSGFALFEQKQWLVSAGESRQPIIYFSALRWESSDVCSLLSNQNMPRTVPMGFQ